MEDNGLISKVFGEKAWFYNHCVTFGYPLNPNIDQQQKYYQHFQLLGDIFPCNRCGKNYNRIIKTPGETELNQNVMKNRSTLTRWFYNVHNRVNKEIGEDYLISYDDLVKKYEKFRARCSSGNLIVCRTIAYRAANKKNMAIIPVDLALKLVKKSPIQFDLSYLKLAQKISGNLDELKKLSSWKYRNIYCYQQIEFMKLNGISSINQNNTLSEEEYKLIFFLCSNLSVFELMKYVD